MLQMNLYIPHGSDESTLSCPDAVLHLTLYPTWFRWKLCYCFFKPFVYLLYIPHGSDESFLSQVKPLLFPTFISHMVQMKGIKKFQCFIFTPHLYIPHGSDERQGVYSVEKLLTLLYIPHGSDESWGNKTWRQDAAYCFISHMVQMKD